MNPFHAAVVVACPVRELVFSTKLSQDHGVIAGIRFNGVKGVDT